MRVTMFAPLLLAGIISLAPAGAAYAGGSSGAALERQAYSRLIARIKNTADPARRESLMHKAEDVLMETDVLLPLYYFAPALDPETDGGNFTDGLSGESYGYEEESGDLTDSAELYTEDSAGTCCLCFNEDGPLFEGKKAKQAGAVRRALNLLIDRNYIAENAAGEEKEPANTLIPAGVSDGRGGEFRANDRDYTYPCEEAAGYYELSYEAYDENLEEAMTLLAENGYEFDADGMLSDKTPLNITYLVKKGTVQEEIAEIIREDFAVIGADVTIDRQRPKAFGRKQEAGDFDMILVSCSVDYDDPAGMLEKVDAEFWRE